MPPRRCRASAPHAALALLGILALALAGCGSSASGASGEMQVTGATVAVPPNPSQAAVRLVIDNRTGRDDELVSASAEVAADAQVHRSEIDGEGRATMATVTKLPIPAGEKVAFEPGGLHVMLTGLRRPLQAGQSFDLELTFAEAGRTSVSVEVVAGAGGADEMPGMEGAHHGG